MPEKKVGFGLLSLIFKLGTKIATLIPKMLKGAKFTKVGLAGASFGGYAAIYSWKFALLILIAVGFHEAGHVWAMKKMGLKTKGFYFIPFVGGVAISEDKYKTYAENVFVSIMGPIWGAAMAWACGLIYWTTGNPMWAAAAAWMSTLNLFNLLPITPLDGGQLMRSIAFSIGNRTGFVFLCISIVLAMLAAVTLNVGLFGFILLIGSLELYIEFRARARKKKDQQTKTILKEMATNMGLEQEYVDEISPEKINNHPTAMNKDQLILSIISFVGTIAVLVLLLKLTAHVPGADLAHNFLE